MIKSDPDTRKSARPAVPLETTPMQVHITARHLRLTQPIRGYVEQKVGKAQKYFSDIIWAQVVLSIEKRAHQAEVVVHAKRQTFRSLAQGADLYSAIDLATDKIDGQLKKYKDRLTNHHKGKPADLDAVPVELGTSELQVSVTKQELKPVSREQAIDEMDERGDKFRLFLDKTSGHVSVVYRRDDDTYGLLHGVRKNGK